MSGSNQKQWSWEENKAFENGVALYYKEGQDEEWVKIRSLVPTKTIDEIKVHFKKLMEDLELIEFGFEPVGIDYHQQYKNEDGKWFGKQACLLY